ncbi:MAG: ABC transporter ATP-binding protein [Williamsia sp.]|nr:ABC transporter ATP-binding protein [Williamsia sp.]
MSTGPLIQTRELSIGYAHTHIAGGLNLQLHAGQFVCLLGANGSGKSTLLRTLAALQPSTGGELLLQGKPIQKIRSADIAKIISLVLTDRVGAGNLDVYALIALGRYPHTGWFGILHEQDKQIIEQAIKAARVEGLLTRKFDELSDGEAQKVMLARALAQDTPLIMLDEPTAHIDLPGRIQLMQRLHHLSRTEGKSILISTHELDLALQVADQIWLLLADGTLHTGTPEDLVLNGTFEAAFNREGVVFDRATGSFPVYSPFRNKAIILLGEGAPFLWTKKALLRAGYGVAEKGSKEAPTVVVYEEEGRIWWKYNREGKSKTSDTIAGLLELVHRAL